MASLVNPSNINGNFPIAGQDNDIQGFRDNFTNIRNNFTFIKAEVEDLQAKAVLKSALIGTTLNNDFQGSKVKNLQVSNLTETVKDIGAIDTPELALDLSEGTIVKLLAPNSGDLAISDVIKNWPASLQHARLLLYITVPGTAFTLTLPASWSTDLSSVPGLRRVASKPVISYTDPGDYIYEITSPDSGTTVFFRELTTGNAIFRDPNFYMVGLGIGSVDDVPQRTGFESPTLMIGLGRYLGGATTNQGIGYKIDSLKSGNDTLVIKGSVTSYQSQADDTANVSAGVNSLTSGGFSVVKDRTTITSGTLVTEGNIASGDLVGYFNAIGLTKNSAASTLAYQQLGTIQFVAEGTTTSPFGVGGQILIKTKGDGTADDLMPNSVVGAYNYKFTKGALRTAVTIDAKQNVTVHGNLLVMGETTVVESNTVTVEDKNIVLGNGGTETTNQGAGIFVYSDAADGGANISLSDARWVTNRGFTVANTLPGNALIVNGNAAVGGNLYVTGAMHVANIIYQNIEITTSTETVEGTLTANGTTAATSTGTGALVVKGGAGIANGLYVNGTTYLQNVSSGNVLLTGGSAYDLTHLAATGGHVLTFNAANFTSANLWTIGGVIGINPGTGAVVPAANAYIGTGWFANLSTANAQITGGSISGITLPSITDLVVTNFSTGNAVVTGGYAQGLANVYATTAQATNFSTANAIVTAGTATTLVATNFSTANAQVTGGSVTGVTGAASTLVATNFSTGNAAITGGSITGVTGAASTLVATNFSTGNAAVTGGSVTGITGAASTLVATNFSSGNAQITGTATTLVATNFSTANAQVTGGSVTGITGAASTLVATNFSTANAQVTGGSVTGITGAASTLVATNFSSGNLIATGAFVTDLSAANLFQTGSQSIQTANLAMTGGNIGMNFNKVVSLIGNLYTTIGFAQNFSTSNLVLGAGTTTVAPLTFTSGTNLTSPVAGVVEYDGAVFHSTGNSTLGRGLIPSTQMYKLTASGSAISATAAGTNYFGASSNIPLVANGIYEVEFVAFFSKVNATTVTFNFVWTGGAPSNFTVRYEMSPITGIVAPPGTATMLSGQAVGLTTSPYTVVTGSLSNGVNHYVRFVFYIQAGAASTGMEIEAFNGAAGSLTPLSGSFWKATRLPGTNTGTYIA